MSGTVYGVDSREYRLRRANMGSDMHNGAYYYAVEIERRIIPNVQTDRAWVTLNNVGCEDGAIVFVHNNLHPENYDWLSDYDDLVLVCGIPETVEKVSHLGTAIYLPLSIDVEEVMSYAMPKTRRKACRFGRPGKVEKASRNADRVCGLPRGKALNLVAQYESCYAVGRCAIEARALGCKILPYDPRFPDPSIWKVIDNLEAAEILQRELDRIDG